MSLFEPTDPPAPDLSPPGRDVPPVVTGQLIHAEWGTGVAEDLSELWGVANEVHIGPDPPTDPAVELWYDTSEVAPGGGDSSMIGPTIDTDELYRIIMFSDGTVRAIPITAEAPDIPEDLTLTIRVSSVKLTWTAAAGATAYRIYRDGSLHATVSSLKYRDGAVTVGETYSYTVQAVSAYGLYSAQTAAETAFIDPALNVTPFVTVKTWPPTSIALGNRAIVRVNAIDVDGQLLAETLGTDVGSLVATADPSVWYLDPA